MQSISIKAPAGRPNTAKVALAGGLEGKYSAYIALISANEAMSGKEGRSNQESRKVTSYCAE